VTGDVTEAQGQGRDPDIFKA